MGPLRTWTDSELRSAVASARSLADVLRALGVKQQRTVVRRATELGVQIPGATRQRWTDDELRAAVASARTAREALHLLNLRGSGGNYRTFRRHVARLAIDTSHFVGKAHLAGRARENLRSRRPLSDLLVENGSYDNTSRLRQRLIRERVLEARCAECGLDAWRGRPIPLELDHINGERSDLRPGNLRLLCPNCHALTPTYKGKNTMRARRTIHAAQ
jgi:5-methylcytosine-specific restriction endonuclease McrA